MLYASRYGFEFNPQWIIFFLMLRLLELPVHPEIGQQPLGATNRGPAHAGGLTRHRVHQDRYSTVWHSTVQCIYLSINVSMFLFNSISIYLSLYLYIFMYLSIYLSIYIFTYISIYLSI